MTAIATSASAERRAHYRSVNDRPSERRFDSLPDAPRGCVRTEVRSADVASDGTAKVGGVASVVETGYEMYDMFGPYTEVVSRDAFDKTLAANPTVEFALNHGRSGGPSMASTRNGTLRLWTSDDGLEYEADVDATRSDVSDMVKALKRGDLAEASFKFRITSGQWSPDYTEYRINEVDLHRGDVSAVNFGANPSASSTLRERLEAAVEARALDPEDVNIITQSLAKFAAIDNIVDDAQVQLAEYLGVPNPDVDDERNAATPVEIRAEETHHLPDFL